MSEKAAVLVTKVRVHPGGEKAFAKWHARATIGPGEFPGFISAEVKPPDDSDDKLWSVVQRFRGLEEMHAWQASEAHQRLLSDAGSLKGGSGADVSEAQNLEGAPAATVTEVITTIVKPGFERAYRDWAAKIHSAEAQFPGYRGGFLQPPISAKQPYWTTLVHFATPTQLDTWLDSAERKKLLAEHTALVESWTAHRLPNSFAGWFPAESSDREPSTTLKQSMVVLLMLFPIVMAEVRYLSPRIAGWPPSIGTFFGNAISVGLLAWPFMPIAIYFLNWWLTPKKGGPILLRAGGYLLIAVLYAAEITALWNLL
jgi:antibiotic biosynthesis monooxygenase (ABM) superfamily enzyme